MPTPLRCDPKLLEKDLSSQVIIVTGANSGCGLETSRQLVKQGAIVVMACRNEQRGRAAADEVGGYFLTTLDLASLQSVRDFVKAYNNKYHRLDALVNNAGIMACPYEKTQDGFEMQLGCNHLGHFLLTHLLTKKMLETARMTKKPSRLVVLSSCAAAEMAMGDVGMPNVDFDDINWEKREYSEEKAYAQSKLCNYLHALGMSRKYPPEQIVAVSVHPGWVRSNLDVHTFRKYFGDQWYGRIMSELVRQIFLLKGDMISAQDGAQTSLHCILDDSVESGKFYSQFGIYKDYKSRNGGWPMELPNPNATPENADKLWEVSLKMVGVSPGKESTT